MAIEAGVRLPDVKFMIFRESVYRIRIHVLAPDKTQFSYKNGCGIAVDAEDGNPFS
jgi:hypothetical protein